MTGLFDGATKAQLRDREWLEQAILGLGIYPAEEIPRAIWQPNDSYLGICQFPVQFAPYLIHLSRLNLKTYAEIGLWEGGTLRTTSEYLSHFGLEFAIGIDIRVRPRVKDYAQSNPLVPTMLVQADSRSPEAERVLAKYEPDLIMVDGDHTEEGCRADWEMARRHARWVGFHDIVGIGYPGVGKVWRGLRHRSKREFVEQYPETEAAPQNGIGLVKVR